jgi:lysophospholipid acyltransferase (LPLAT)-like uncharacterized protein
VTVPDRPKDLPDSPAVVPWYHWVWVIPAAMILRLWLATLRVHSNVKSIDDRAGPVVILLWHDKLFTSSLIANHHFSRPITALISTSKDGAWLVAFFRVMGLTAVRGSSNKRGAAALIALTRTMRRGNHTGITPDGPKGPAYKFKTGAIALARLTHSPFVILGIQYRHCWRLRSWDRFALPMPFSRVDVQLIQEPTPSPDEADETIAQRLERSLNETSGVGPN